MWDARQQAAMDDIIHMLQIRFGTELQSERFKTKLHARYRGHGEPFLQLS